MFMHTIETGRPILCPFHEGDTEALFLLLREKEVNTFLPLFPLTTMEEAKKYLKERYLEDTDGCHFAICLKPNASPVGYVNAGGGASHDFGYALRKEYWHRGIMTEACRAVVDRLKLNGIPFITATHDVKNPRSEAVMKRTGMSYQYSYREFWQPKGFWVTFRMYQLYLDRDKKRVYRGYWDRYPDHFVEETI